MSKRKRIVVVSSSDEEGEEIQQPLPKKPTAGSPSRGEDGGFNYIPLPNLSGIQIEPGTYHDYKPSSPRMSDDEDDDFKSENSDDEMLLCNTYSLFLEEITLPTSIYTTNFQEKKDELAARLYELYNNTIFENKLPDNMKIIWNKRLTKTAGYCDWRSANYGRYCVINLSEKLIDSAARLRDALVHEMCHAACWIIDRQSEGEDHHGPLWRAYAAKVTNIHPELPKVKVYHNYDTNYPYFYQCSLCQRRVGRFKKIKLEHAHCRFCVNSTILMTIDRK